MAINSVLVTEEFDQVLKSVEYPVEAEYDCKCDGSQKENTEGCCIKQLSPDYIFKLRAIMVSVTEREKRSSMYMGKSLAIYIFSSITFLIFSETHFHCRVLLLAS